MNYITYAFVTIVILAILVIFSIYLLFKNNK